MAEDAEKRIAKKGTAEAGEYEAPYQAIFGDVSKIIDAARESVVRSANAAMTAAYWLIGRRIVEFEQSGEERAEYGAALVERLAEDLTGRFGRGFSRQNIQNMRLFYLSYPPGQIRQTPSGIFESASVEWASRSCLQPFRFPGHPTSGCRAVCVVHYYSAVCYCLAIPSMLTAERKCPHDGACEIDAARTGKTSGTQQLTGWIYDDGAGSDTDGTERTPYQAHTGGIQGEGSSRNSSRQLGSQTCQHNTGDYDGRSSASGAHTVFGNQPHAYERVVEGTRRHRHNAQHTTSPAGERRREQPAWKASTKAPSSASAYAA